MKSLKVPVLAAAAVVVASGWVVVQGVVLPQTHAPATENQIKTAIELYIEQDTAIKGGFFLWDARDGSVRQLSFQHVHDGSWRASGPNQVMCVGFRDEGGDELDVDFAVRPGWSGSPEVHGIVIHAASGVHDK